MFFFSAGEDLQTCVQDASAPLSQLFSDIKDLSNQSERFVRDIPSDFSTCASKSLLEQPGCYLDVSNVDISRGLLLVSSLSSDLTAYGTQLEVASKSIVTCGLAEVQGAVQKFANILQTVESCILTVPSAA
jgi:hypothetical protein